MVTFDLALQTAGSLHPGGGPADFISAYRGAIRCTRGRDGKAFRVGRVKAYRIHAGLAGRAGEPLCDACDAHSQGLHEVYAALFDAKADDLRGGVRARFDCFEPDVLVLDYVLLAPRWRFGRKALPRRLLEGGASAGPFYRSRRRPLAIAPPA
jgi:hypothetical protein